MLRPAVPIWQSQVDVDRHSVVLVGRRVERVDDAVRLEHERNDARAAYQFVNVSLKTCDAKCKHLEAKLAAARPSEEALAVARIFRHWYLEDRSAPTAGLRDVDTMARELLSIHEAMKP